MTDLHGQKYCVRCAMPLRSQSAVSATHRAKDREVRLAHAFDRLHAVPYCPKTVCAQPCCESTFGRTPRTKCAASCALFCDLIKKSTSRLRLERGAGALLSYRVAQPGKGSTFRVRRPHPLRSRGTRKGFCVHTRTPRVIIAGKPINRIGVFRA